MVAAAGLPLAAQTTGHPVHHPAAGTAAHREEGGCVASPELSPTIPALPATATCVKKLYTLTRVPTLKLDYGSPLLSPELRAELGESAETFSLEYADAKAGTGARIEAHQCVSVQYTGWLTDGKKFDSSHDHPGGEPIEFLYGGHHVIPGWDTGFEGMRVGGERRLFIPYELAYGETGRGPIPPKAELVFDVEAVSEKAPRAGAPPGAECMPAAPPHPLTPPGASHEPGAAGKPQ